MPVAHGFGIGGKRERRRGRRRRLRWKPSRRSMGRRRGGRKVEVVIAPTAVNHPP
jgi:hypothetical protein